MQRVQPVSSLRAALCATLLLATAAACGGDTSEDAAAGDTGAAMAAAPADTGMAGMDHSKMAGMDRPAARDSNQAFLRMMSDHHEGLIAIADSAEARAQGATTKTDARQLVEKQRREQQEMLAMLGRQYQDSIHPMMMPSNRAMLDSTVRATGATADTTFYRQVVHHHREGVAMSEPMLPHLSGEVRQMADRMIADQRREIEEFERKARTEPPR